MGGATHERKNGAAAERISVGSTIRKLRQKAGLSGVELCEKSGGIDPRTLNAIEKGRIRNPSLEMLARIASGLGCLMRDLFTSAEMELRHNYHVGSQKGVFHLSFPRVGLKVVSATPPLSQFFCGKFILAAHCCVEDKFFRQTSPIFIEVLMGRVEFEIEDAKLSLKEGETLFFNGGLRHAFRNVVMRESVLWVVTAPSFFRT